MKKTVKLAKKVGTKFQGEIVADMPQPISGKLIDIRKGNAEYIVLVRDPQTKRLVRYGTEATLRKATSSIKSLEKKGLDSLYVIKEKTVNQYDGIFLVEMDGNITQIDGLQATIYLLNEYYRKQMNLRKNYTRSKTEKWLGFVYNTKTGGFVCTRPYDDIEKATAMITKRNYGDGNTIKLIKADKSYLGYEFKDQALDAVHRLKQAKEILTTGTVKYEE